jgi:hypothetical protein
MINLKKGRYQNLAADVIFIHEMPKAFSLGEGTGQGSLLSLIVFSSSARQCNNTIKMNARH